MAKTKKKTTKKQAASKAKTSSTKKLTKKKAASASKASVKKLSKKATVTSSKKKQTKLSKASPSKKKVTKKAVAKVAAKPSAKKATAKKAPVKKVAPKKATAKKAVEAKVERKPKEIAVKPVKKAESTKEASTKDGKASTSPVKAASPEKPAKANAPQKTKNYEGYDDESSEFDDDISNELDGLKAKRNKLFEEEDIEAKLDSMSFEELAALDPEAFEEEDEDEVVLTDAEGRPYCRVKDCDELSLVDGYCRYHYLAQWKRIQMRKKILAGGKLDRYIEELTARYPDKYLEMLRKDLSSEKDFMAVVHDLEIEDGNLEGDFEDDDKDYLDEVRGVGSDDDSGGGGDDY